MEAIEVILGSGDDLLLSAETASGKTEAAFLPILSSLAREPAPSIGALYVGPLRALINDQFSRLDELCTYLDLPVARWHAEVAQGAKQRVLQAPSGVLLITPESLESLFINRTSALARLFCGLRFAVIDELHAFLGVERGMHLASLLERLRRVAGPQRLDFRRIGLSATIGDDAPARAFLRPEDPARVQVVRPPSEGKELQLKIHAFEEEAQPEGEEEAGLQDAGADRDAGTDPSIEVLRPIAQDLVIRCREGSNLVFANRKGDVEVLCDLAGEWARERGIPAPYLVHHGSLARDIRETTEDLMKREGDRTAFCSSTLELGIDIGSVRLVAQVGPPWSVSSLKQRLGRSGRHEGEPRRLRLYVPQRLDDAQALLGPLHRDLLAAIATVQLMLEGWVEPVAPPRCDLSTLTQQVLSVIVERRGARADELYDVLCRAGPFREVEPALFASFLRCLGRRDVVEQTGRGDLILGLAGESIVGKLDFYGAFVATAGLRVVSGGTLLGTLPVLSPPRPGGHIVFAGKRWRVLEVNVEAGEIVVEGGKAHGRPKFVGRGGEIHSRVREEQRRILSTDECGAYIDSTGQRLLGEAQRFAREVGLTRGGLVSIGDRTLIPTWTGTRVQKTLLALLELSGVKDYNDEDIGVLIDAPPEEVTETLERLVAGEFEPLQVAELVAAEAPRKFDALLDEELLRISAAREIVDIPGAQEVARRVLEK